MTASGQLAAVGSGLRTFAGDVAEGFFEITHNGLALLGVLTALTVVLLGTRADLRQQGEDWLADRLLARKVAAMGITPEPGAIERATAADPRELPREQASVTQWIARKYRVAPEPVAALVAEAYDVGRSSKLEPTLILAIMAVESSFNPFAQSTVGAQGLMQVMTSVHTDKYEGFGGQLAAFDPVANLRVGVKVLQECIARAGSLEGGLRYYVGAANLPHDGGYAAKVLAEHFRLRQVAGRPAAATPVLSTKAPAATEIAPTAKPAEEKVALLDSDA